MYVPVLESVLVTHAHDLPLVFFAKVQKRVSETSVTVAASSSEESQEQEDGAGSVFATCCRTEATKLYSCCVCSRFSVRFVVSNFRACLTATGAGGGGGR